MTTLALRTRRATAFRRLILTVLAAGTLAAPGAWATIVPLQGTFTISSIDAEEAPGFVKIGDQFAFTLSYNNAVVDGNSRADLGKFCFHLDRRDAVAHRRRME